MNVILRLFLTDFLLQIIYTSVQNLKYCLRAYEALSCFCFPKYCQNYFKF